MVVTDGIRTFLTAKVAPVAAATLLIGGGAAIAAPGGPFGAGEDGSDSDLTEFPGEGWAIGRADEDQLARIAKFCNENPEAAFCSGPSWVPGAPSDEDPEEMATQPEALDEEEDARSETARRVHEALTGGDAIVPGDPKFGSTVSERARTGQLGGLVSRAARGEEIEDFHLDKPREPGRPDHARGGSESSDADEADEPVATEAEPKVERRGPPVATSRGNSGNSGNSGNRGPQGRGPGR